MPMSYLWMAWIVCLVSVRSPKTTKTAMMLRKKTRCIAVGPIIFAFSLHLLSFGLLFMRHCWTVVFSRCSFRAMHTPSAHIGQCHSCTVPNPWNCANLLPVTNFLAFMSRWSFWNLLWPVCAFTHPMCPCKWSYYNRRPMCEDVHSAKKRTFFAALAINAKYFSIIS